MSASKPRKAINAARSIVLHPTVSRAMCGTEALTPALDCLRRARISQGNWRAARRNAAEDAPQALRIEARGGSAWDAGLAIGPPPASPVVAGIAHRFHEALAAEGLPEGLREPIAEWLDLYDPCR